MIALIFKDDHHGSLNATPKQMIRAHLTRRKTSGSARLRAMV